MPRSVALASRTQYIGFTDKEVKLTSPNDYDFNEEQKAEIIRIFREQYSKGIERMESHSLIFRLKEEPGYVFKHFGEGTANHYENVHQVAKRICFDNGLYLLVPPKSALVYIDGNSYIAEEYLNIYPDPESQKHLFYQLSDQLTETMRQLAIFIVKMGFDDVTERNIPILNDGSTPPRIALIDPGRVGFCDLSKSVADGFFGSINGSCGLINCATSSEQIEAIFSIMESEGVNTSEAVRQFCEKKNTEIATLLQNYKSARLDLLKRYKGIDEYYARKQFVTGKEPIEVDIHSLELDLSEKASYFCFGKSISNEEIRREEWQNSWLRSIWLMITGREKHEIEKSEGFYEYQNSNEGKVELIQVQITLETVVKELIDVINRLITEQSGNKSIRGIRSIYLLDDAGPYPNVFYKYKKLGLNKFTTYEDNQNSTWIFRILQSLVDKGHIFNYSFDFPHLHIQA